MKVALITGANSEIGSCLTKKLLDNDFIVHAQIHTKDDRLRPFLKNPALNLISADLSTADKAQELITKVIQKSEHLDLLINTIGPYLERNLSEITPTEWDSQMHLNLNLPFYLSHFASKHLIATKGQIINFTFAGGEFPKAHPEATPYSAAKLGLAVLTKSYAKLLAPYQVRVNAISLGLIEEEATSMNSPSEESRLSMLKQIPLGRMGTPDEIAQLLLWIAQEAPKYLTGAMIPLSGAWEY